MTPAAVIAARGRESLRTRWDRLRGRSFLIAQCAVSAAVAFWLASTLLGHDRPFFAPVAAIVSLGVSYGARLRRAAEVTAGVAVGIGVGDLFVHLVGTGVWQVAVVVGVAMSVAVLLDAGALLVTQAAVQGVIVTTLLPDPSAGLGRWLDAVVGGAVALVAAMLVPASPLRRPRQLAAQVLTELADLLREAARCGQQADATRAVLTLERARRSESSLTALRSASREGLDATRSSPLRRSHRPDVQAVADLTEPLDRAIRNVRVLARRVVAMTRRGETLPSSYVVLLTDLADATDGVAGELRHRRRPETARAGLLAVAEATAGVDSRAGLSAEVVLAQARSIVVDLLQITGLDADAALAALPPERREPLGPDGG